MNFKILSTDGLARRGVLETTRGTVQTPVFLPVGTHATVKAVSSDDLLALGYEMILGSTYHLYLRPGADTIEKMGGLHQFMNWQGPIFTDSGGFQVFSLGIGIEHEVGKMIPLYGDKLVLGEVVASEETAVAKTNFVSIADEGPTFKSHLDGTKHFFSPELSIQTQVKLGADFIVALDELTSPLHGYDYTKESLARTNRWEKRSLEEFKKLNSPRQRLFGVVQGGPFEDLRIESAKFTSKEDFFGIAVGGALVNREKMIEILNWINPHLEESKPRHLFGIGTIPDIFLGVERGMDMFDAVVPTRLARMGHILTRRTEELGEDYNPERFAYDVNKIRFKEDAAPLQEGCNCYTCQKFTRAYIHHLFRSRELLVYRLITIHNLAFMAKLMAEIRAAISEKRFAKLKENWLS